MDMVGPVERSKAGNPCVVIKDYTTKYPEVFPTKGRDAKSVTFYFSSLSFPCDQITNLMSIQLKQLHQLLVLGALWTSTGLFSFEHLYEQGV